MASEKHRVSRIDQLAEHRFSKLVMQNVQPLIKATEPQLLQAVEEGTFKPRLNSRGEILLDKPDPWRKSDLAPEQTYHSDAALYLANLIGAVERLGEVEVYLHRFPQPRTYEKQKITEDKWIHYHHSNYLLTIVSIYDIALILTNIIFLLKLVPQECKHKTILKNDSVKSTLVALTLKNLDKIISDYRKPRNLYVHRNELPTIKSIELLKILSLLQNFDISYLPTKHLDILYETARKNLITDLSRDTDKITDGLSRFFDALYPIYVQQTENLLCQ